jgi:hypothetical protein
MMAGYEEVVMILKGRLKGKAAVITGAASGIGKAHKLGSRCELRR